MKRFTEGLKRLFWDAGEFIFSVVLGFGYIAACIGASVFICSYFFGICMSCPKTTENDGEPILVIALAAFIFFIPSIVEEIIKEYFE